MPITITARHASIGEEVKSSARQSLVELEEMWGRDASAHMIIDAEKKGYMAEINLQAGHRQINCRARHRDVRVAVNQSVKKCEKRLKKIKGRMANRHKPKIQAPYQPEDFPQDIPRLVRNEDFVLETLTEREASIRIREISPSFLVYRGGETGKLSVLYRRQDGDLGLIEINDEKR